MGDGIGAGLLRDLDQPLGDQRTGDGGPKAVFPLVQSIGSKHREDEIAGELFAQVIDIDLLHTHGLGLGAGRLDLLALTDVRGEGHHFAVIFVLQPLENDGGIEATGISQNHFLDVRHEKTPD